VPDRVRSFDDPDAREELPLELIEEVAIGTFNVARETLQAGWRWSTHLKPIVGTELCEFRHVGVQISGRWVALSRDGIETQVGPGDVYDIGPGHDSWVVGDEASVGIGFQGTSGRDIPPSTGQMVVTTVLFTDIADSTRSLERMGSRRWSRLLEEHHEDVRRRVAARGGREVKSTGDGFLITFAGAEAGLRCAAAIVGDAARLGLAIRAGVHTGEVELVDEDIRGADVHLAARVMAAANPGEVLASSTTRDLVTRTTLVFEEKGSFDLKGITGARTLYILRPPPA
jgi:class 3 adenylate cyclase